MDVLDRLGAVVLAVPAPQCKSSHCPKAHGTALTLLWIAFGVVAAAAVIYGLLRLRSRR